MNHPIFNILVFNEYGLLQEQVTTKRCSTKISIFKKAFLHSSCSALVIKKLKKKPVVEFNFSEIIVLHPATLPNNELFCSHFSKFLIIILEWCIIMVQWPCLKISKIVWEEWQEYIQRGIPNRGNKIWSGDDGICDHC